MEPGASHTFDSFRLEPPPGGVWRGDVRLALRPRSLAMLRYLVAQAGRLVTKAALRQQRLGRHARERHGPAGMCPGDSRGFRRRRGSTAVS